MSKSIAALHHELIQLSEPIRASLSRTQYSPPEGSNVSIKSMLESLLPQKPSTSDFDVSEPEILSKIKDFSLCCAALTSFAGSTHDQLSWMPNSLSIAAELAFGELSKAYSINLSAKQSTEFGELGLDLGMISDEKKLGVELMPIVLPLLKASIKESSIDKSDDGDEMSTATSRVPVVYAIVAAYQFRWFVTQVDYPHLGKLCSLVIPCALTALDHWSPEVKGQGMISFIHLVKNVNAAELSWYEDVILDACCQNIASDDEIWHHVVEMSVLLATSILRSNPRSPWYEKMLNEMLSHLERQPRNKERRVAWLQCIEPLLEGVGLVLLAHFRRIFPLFFQWMHADDDVTVLLVLERVHTVLKLTWIRNTTYTERLVDELATLYKEAALKISREEIRARILQILILLQQCKGSQFKAAWDKHKDDPNLTALAPSFSGINAEMVVR
ncbi:uncharacterized protein At2g39910 isoform X2 [Cornus florida]|uniref:uncharacterized protein At2g39910 isoform X2 n=1 Tax=Cornus florida TaxID=4283 RepID=UPI0028A1A004|nr:uncharacterized protein At2g39910 isoform X2 [Cornus florida]